MAADATARLAALSWKVSGGDAGRRRHVTAAVSRSLALLDTHGADPAILLEAVQCLEDRPSKYPATLVRTVARLIAGAEGWSAAEHLTDSLGDLNSFDAATVPFYGASGADL